MLCRGDREHRRAHRCDLTATVVVETTATSARFAVSDTGVGFDPDAVPWGSGLLSISDRILALGGRVEVSSSPGAGTTVSGEIPLNVRS